MEKIIQNQEKARHIRSEFKSKGKHIVRYENVERNVNKFLSGEAKLTPTILSDINNLVEGVVLDSCIEMDLSDRQIKENAPLTEKLLDISDYVIGDVDIDEEVNQYITPALVQFQIECLQNMLLGLKNGRVSSRDAERLNRIVRPFLESSEVGREIFRLIPLFQEGKWKEYFQGMNSLIGSLGDIDELAESILSVFKDMGVITTAYDLDKSSDQLEFGLMQLASNQLFDPYYNLAKSASLAYQWFYGQQGMSVRLPAQLRYPLMHGLNSLKATYEVYHQIAEIHEVSVDLLVKYGGSIRIYIPPLLSILLDRCERSTDFPNRLFEMRGDFSNIRSSFEIYYKDLGEAKSLKDHLEIAREMSEGINLLKKKLTEICPSIVYQTWNVVKSGSTLKIFTGALDLLVEKDKQNKVLRCLQPLVDLWTMSLNVKDYGNLLVKVFGDRSIDHNSFQQVDNFTNIYSKFLNLERID